MCRSFSSQFAVGIISALSALFAAGPTMALAQGAMAQTGSAGPPNVSVLPYPDPVFKGIIGRTTADSKSDFPQPVRAPEGAPNILVILTDDVGFGASSTFGGPVPTPTLEALAARGLKYNAFSTTALCSPTRAALITGRDQHTVHTGIIMERSLGYPGYDSLMPKSAGTVGEILRGNGYSTAWFGKNHNVPAWQSSALGPFDLWPTGLGFEYFYGFIGGDTDQWDPTVFENTIPVEPKEKLTGEARANYNLDADLADQAIHWIQQQHAIAPNKPFFAYYAPGATHAPHHVPKDWIAKFKGQFDQGWDKLREETFARQKKLGVIPQDAILTPRPANLPAWDSLDARHKELFAHMAEIYAGFLAYDDYNIGRVIDSLKQEGVSDNTLVIFIEGDNGSSAEGTLQGTANEVATVGNGAPESFDYLYSIKDGLGGPLYYNHMPVPWSWAFDTPFQWTKRYASHFGGTRNGMVMSWPGHIKDVGALREQFHYVTDIMPTILEAAGVKAPDKIDGVKQLPIDGVSMAYTWDDAKAPSHRVTQLFEMFGNRGIYHDGWMASTTPLVFAWEPEPKGITPESFNWELYDLHKDFSQGNDLAKAIPEKLKQMEELWWAEAGRNNALPLNFSPQATVEAVFQKPSLTRGRSHFVFRKGTVRIPEGTAPTVKNTSYTITAKLNVPDGGADGVIVTQGGRFAGWGLVVLDGKLVWAYKNTQQPNDGIRISGPNRLTPGDHVVSVNFAYDGKKGEFGKGGAYLLTVDGAEVARTTIDHTVPFIYSVDETLDVGEDRGTPILEDYADRMPFKYSGRIDEVDIDLAGGNAAAEVPDIDGK
jgi:arylsulfatase A-like enzyme